MTKKRGRPPAKIKSKNFQARVTPEVFEMLDSTLNIIKESRNLSSIQECKYNIIGGKDWLKNAINQSFENEANIHTIEKLKGLSEEYINDLAEDLCARGKQNSSIFMLICNELQRRVEGND